MIFGKIDFINLLPFHIYINKTIQSTQIKAIINYKKSYPSLINKKFKNRTIDAAFISSIVSKSEKSLNLGIVAKKEVLSVIAILGEQGDDYQSETSNTLAKILNIKGRVLIGDKALKYYYESSNRDFIDLAKTWNDKYNLPFVFAILCFNKNKTILKKIIKNFEKTKIKIPQYQLQKYSQRADISKNNILNYLKCIDYKISLNEKKALKLFFNLAKQKGV